MGCTPGGTHITFIICPIISCTKKTSSFDIVTTSGLRPSIDLFNASQHSLQTEHQRPCWHAIAVMTATQRHNFDLMDMAWFGSVWHVSTWEKQYRHRVTRASGMQATDIVENELLPAQLCAKPGRKKLKPHVSLQAPDPASPHLRNHVCGQCGRYGHNRAGCRAPNINVICRNNRTGARKEVQMSTHPYSVMR